jgi:hypothetical protein
MANTTKAADNVIPFISTLLLKRFSLSDTLGFTGNAHAAFHTPDEPVIGNWVTPIVFSERGGQAIDTKGKDCRFSGNPHLTVMIATVTRVNVCLATTVSTLCCQFLECRNSKQGEILPRRRKCHSRAAGNLTNQSADVRLAQG